MAHQHSPFDRIIIMARTIAASGRAGSKGSKAEAEDAVREIIGPVDRSFRDEHGVTYWAYLKQLLGEYVVSRGLQERLVVKGAPFNYHGAVGTSCSAVMLRKDFHKGEAHVEPEMFLEVGMVHDRKGDLVPGVTCGFHYLSSPEGDRSRFVQGVLDDQGTRTMAWALSNDGFLNPSFRSKGPEGRWGMDATLVKVWSEDELPRDIQEKVFRALDELLPLFLRIVSTA